MTNENTEKLINVMQAMSCNLDSNLSFSVGNSATGNLDGLTYNAGSTGNNFVTIGGWDYWTHYYYPQVIHQSYPVYIQEQAKDNGKKAFEIIKILKDKKLVKLDKVSDFIDLMDELIKIL